MAYRPAGYFEEDGDTGEEGGFYFGDEEDLDVCDHKLRVTVTMTPGSSESGVAESNSKKDVGSFQYSKEIESTSSSSGTCLCPVDACTCSWKTAEPITSTSQTSTSDTAGDSATSVKNGRNTSEKHYSSGKTGSFGLESNGSHTGSKKKKFMAESTCKVRDQRSLKSLEDLTDIKVAIAKGNEEAILEKLDSGLELTAPLSTGWPPLLHACENCRANIVKLFLDRGADANTSKDQLSALMVVCMNRSNSPDRNTETCVDLLLERGALVNAKDRYGMTPLLYACQSGQYLVVRKLIAAGADVSAREVRGWTALHYTANLGHTALARLLVDSGADVTAVCNMGESALGVAYSNGRKSTAEYLEAQDNKRKGMTSIPQQQQGMLEKDGTTDDVGAAEASRGLLDLPCSAAGSVVGDLELFLMGLQLTHLIPSFHQHNVEFSQLMSMTDEDLQKMGVDKVGSRKKILNAILEMHKNEWHMPNTTLPYNRLICSGELCVLLSHLSRHADYLRSSAHFILTHLRSNPDIVGPHMEPKELSMLKETLNGAEVATQQLIQEIDSVKGTIRENVSLSDEDLRHGVKPVFSCTDLLRLSRSTHSDVHGAHRGQLSRTAKLLIGVTLLAGVGAGSWAILRQYGIGRSISMPSL